ncbi:MAG: cell division protein FtsZ [Candidatus Borkfalkiaceae bacterium]|nr:cell division protein FtsZ [Clostridia bacterium]MDY6223423.1 cell division protein FtsZ [Christensenellaceae bacterium]
MTEDFYTYDETEERELTQTSVPLEEEAQDGQFGVAKIKVIGVGGAGGNAVNRLIESGLKAAEYYVVNTDNQVLARSLAQNRIQIGVKLTKGLGAGADPTVGKLSAEENKDQIQQILKGTDLLFITAGMGGGTGTGASPVIAKLAREMKILTVAVVTLPFSFEGKKKMDYALAGVEELRKYVDSIIVIPNDKLRGVVKQGTSFPEALKVADEVLRQGIRGIAELIVNPSLINLDFADVRTTLKDRGVAHMGIGIAKGEKRIADAVRCAICSPLLNTTIEGASSVILNVVGGNDLTLDEVCQAAELVKGVIDYSANVIFGACIEESMSDEVEVVIIATGFPSGGQSITGTNDMQSAAQRAAALSDKIDRAFGYTPSQEAAAAQNAQSGYAPQNGGFARQQAQSVPPAPAPGQNAFYADFAESQNNTRNTQGQYVAQNGAQRYYGAQQPVNGYGMPQNAPYPAAEQRDFEPDTPIEAPTGEPAPEKKRRPKFVDFFMKKNSDKK